MIQMEETIDVRADIRDVFNYVTRFHTIAQWDPEVRRARKSTPGPVAVGSRFELTNEFFGLPYTMTYRVVELSRPDAIVLEGQGESFTVRDSIFFSEIPNGTRIEYLLGMEFHSGRSSMERLLRPYIRWIGRKAILGLKRAFNAKRPPPEMKLPDQWMDRAVLPGMLLFSRYGYLWRKRSWFPLTETLRDRTIVLTGATSGIGLAAAEALAEMEGRMVLVGRHPDKLEAVCRKLIADTGNPNIRGEVADLSRMADVRDLARRLNRDEPAIHVLINNAGALFGRRQSTVDGIERSLAVNLISPFLLTTLLIPKLRESAPSRIINVASGGMYTRRLPVDPEAIGGEPFNGPSAYADAKRGLVVLSEIWAGRYERHGITVNAMHPGWVETPGIRASLPRFVHWTRRILRTPEQGADTIVWLAAARESDQATGRFWLDRRPHPTHVLPGTRESRGDRSRFLNALERLAGVRTPQ